MQRKNRPLLTDTRQSFGAITRLWHWMSAALLAAAVATGFVARRQAEGLNAAEGPGLTAAISDAVNAFAWHKSLGLSLLCLVLLRLLFLGPNRARPALIGAGPRRAFAARATQYVLLLSLLAVPLTGWALHSVSGGFAPHALPLPQTLPLLGPSPDAAAIATGLHRAALILLAGATALHFGAALYHQFRRRDATLRRMLRGTPAPGDSAEPPAGRVRAAGLAALALALGIGWMLGATPHPQPPAERMLEAGGWQVSEGELSLTVTQFGTEITGGFTDWNARIEWDEDRNIGAAGSLRVEVEIDSLALGPLTTQALGPDFFALRDHGRAVFDGVLRRGIDGQSADGTLTLRGVTLPLSFAFRLTIEDGIAYAGGRMVIDRRDYGIGANIPDGAVLAHEVSVSFTLKARRVD